MSIDPNLALLSGPNAEQASSVQLHWTNASLKDEVLPPFFLFGDWGGSGVVPSHRTEARN